MIAQSFSKEILIYNVCVLREWLQQMKTMKISLFPAKRATQNASKKVKIVENGASLNHPLIY